MNCSIWRAVSLVAIASVSACSGSTADDDAAALDASPPDAAPPADATPAVDGTSTGEGYLEVSWILTAGVGSITCTEAGAGSVSLLSTREGTAEVFEDIFACDDGRGTTAALPAGDYTVVVSILEADTDVPLGTSMPRFAAVRPDETVDLGTYNFSFAAPGNIDFSVDYGTPGASNCSGGPGGEVVQWQGTTLTLEGGTACISAELLVDSVSNVADICTAIPTCIERDGFETLVDLPPGDYALTIEGLFDKGGAAVACFRSVVTFSVDGNDDLGILVVPYDGSEDPVFCSTI